MRKGLLFLFLICFLTFDTAVLAEEVPQVEIFNVKINDVVKKRQPNKYIQEETTAILNRINGLYVKINPMPKDGHMIRVPLSPSLTVKNKWFHDFINEVVFIIPEEEEPYLMLLDDENSPHFLITDKDFYEVISLILQEN